MGVPGGSIWPKPIKLVGPKVNLSAYRAASKAARKWAKDRGVSPVKATRALSDTTRLLWDEQYFSNNYGSNNITSSLNGLTERLNTGNRSGRITNNGKSWTNKGVAIENFGRYLGNHPQSRLIDYGKLSPGYVVKPRVAAARSRAKGRM